MIHFRLMLLFDNGFVRSGPENSVIKKLNDFTFILYFADEEVLKPSKKYNE